MPTQYANHDHVRMYTRPLAITHDLPHTDGIAHVAHHDLLHLILLQVRKNST